MVPLAAEEDMRSSKVVEDSVVHSFVVRSLVKTAEEVDRLQSESFERYEQPLMGDIITFVVWWSCRDVRLVEIRATDLTHEENILLVAVVDHHLHTSLAEDMT